MVPPDSHNRDHGLQTKIQSVQNTSGDSAIRWLSSFSTDRFLFNSLTTVADNAVAMAINVAIVNKRVVVEI